MPEYLANGYATSATYNRGSISYEIESTPITLSELEETKPLFEIGFKIKSKDLRGAINGNELNLPRNFYPVGDLYALTQITIIDLKDYNKRLTISAGEKEFLTEEDIKLLNSMKKPEINYIYGYKDIFGDEKAFEDWLNFVISGNNFVDGMEKTGSYTSIYSSDYRKIMIESLGLDEDASINDILSAIASKYYSLTPLKDNGVARSIKRASEEEYFGTIASIDSSICNLANTMAVNLNEDWVYVVGVSHDRDHYNIVSGESHAWVMNKYGEIIDATPSTEKPKDEETNFIGAIIEWGLANKIPLLVLFALCGLLFEKIFGKKIYFKIKVLKVEELVNNPHIAEDYAKVMEVLYGGLNVPIKRDVSEFVESITKDFAGFTKMELEELRKELQEQKTSLNSRRLVKDIPFIRENEQEIKRILEKKNKDKY